MISIKPGVSISGIKPEMVLCISIVHTILESHNIDAVLTSCTDGTHSKNSKHYLGYAIDLRSRDCDQADCPAIASDMQEDLGDEFLVIFEKDHFHIQFNGSIR